jgi:two-component system phosphate regulon response regulator PhoB
MPVKILIVEDEEALAIMLKYNLDAEGYEVSVAKCGDEAEQLISESRPDLVLLDWMLPDTQGIELCRRFRINKSTRLTPIIMITAKGEESDKIRGLGTGADDYIVKPFSLPELMARIKSVLRRSAPERIADTLEIDDLVLDRETHIVRRGKREVRLGPTEYRLLEFLMERPKRVLSREQLLDGVWGQGVFIDERTVDVHIGRLRKAINLGKEKPLVRTVRGTGYAIGGEI